MRAPTPDPNREYDSQSEGETSIGTSIKDERLYTQLVCTAGGQLLALVFVLLVYGVWEVLRDYRNTIVWAILCSIALRSSKDWLVYHCLSMLQQDRTLLQLGLDVLFLPVSVAKSGVQDLWEFMRRWQRYAQEYESSVKERQRMAAADAASPSDSKTQPPPDTEPRASDAQSAERRPEAGGKPLASRRKQSKPKKRRPSKLPPLFRGLVEIGSLGLKAWRRQTRKRPIISHPTTPAEETSTHSLLRGLLLVCTLYQLFVWLHSSWSATIHLFLLTGTAAVSLGILPFLYLGAHMYLSLSAPDDSAARPPHVSSAPSGGGGVVSSPEGKPRGAGLGSRWQGGDALAVVRRSGLYRKYREVDKYVRSLLAGCIHSLVAALLVVGLVLGTICLIIFLSLRIGQESSAAVIAARDAAREWTTTSLPASHHALQAQKNPLRKWVVKQQAYLGQVLEDRLPDAAEWAERQGQNLVAAYNLSQVITDMKALHHTIIPPRSCSDQQKHHHLIALATASVEARKAASQHANISHQIEQAKSKLGERLERLEDSLAATDSTLESREAEAMQKEVIQLEREIHELEAQHAPAHRAMDDAMEQLGRAEADLSRCKALQNRQPAEDANPVVQRLGGQLQGVYSHFWKLQFSEGLSDLWEFGGDVVGLGRQILQGEGELRDVSAIQRLGKAAVDPLVSLITSSLGLLASSTYSTTALAVNGGLSIVRVGVGLLKLGLQMVIFLALLFYLLATEHDPLASAADLLPLSDSARQRASHALTISMRGVFVACIKLSAFHALFTWLSLSASGVHLVYLSTVASAVFASLPFIPSWLVCVPAVAQLALLQDRPVAAVVLMLSHFLAWYIADTVILGEIPNSHPYFTGLAIFGGIATFDNPLQGAIVGPMAITVLSVLYQLHSGTAEVPGTRLSTPGVSGQWRQ